MTPRTTLLLAAASLSLVACEATMSGNADNTTPEDACVAAVDGESGSGGAMVMASETSGSGTRVLVLAGSGQTWDCSVSATGEVQSVAPAP